MRTYVILNPVAGHSDPQEIRRQLAKKMPATTWDVTVRQTQADDDVTQLARTAIDDGYDLLCAAGGDGTVSLVVDALVGTNAQLGIIPAGTTNALAQALGIPRKIPGAIDVIANPGRVIRLDAIEVGGNYYVLAVGVGLSAVTMENTEREAKRRFGEAAYVWTVLRELTGWQPRQFMLDVDGRRQTFRAADIMLFNAGVLTGPLRWGEHIVPDDGRVDVCIIRARNLFNYLGLLADIVRRRQWRNRHIKFLVARERVKISASSALAVTGDGELIGRTPIDARIVSGVVSVRAPSNHR
jgi:YegS/Rv2252/BmrU family lipid kinase